MRSMTGFGTGSASWGQGRVAVDVRTVNHRFLEVRVNAPAELNRFEHVIGRRVRERLSRGFCTVNAFIEGGGVRSTEVNTEALKVHLASLARVGEEASIRLVDLIPVLQSAPDLFSPAADTCLEALEGAATAAFNEAIDNMISMRESDGGSMGVEISKLILEVERKADSLESMRESLGKSAFSRPQKRLEELLKGVDVEVDTGRIEAEIAVLADRLDITEEIVRLRSHVEHAGKLLDESGPVGRRMEFLLQEMVREANTIGSKSQDADVSHIVVDMKADLEKMRELVQNVE